MKKIKIDLTNIKVSLVNISHMEKEDEPLYSSDEEEQSDNENTEEEDEKSEVDDKSEIEQDEQDDEPEDEPDVVEEDDEVDEKDDESDDEVIDDEAKLYSGGKPKKAALVGGSLENSDDEDENDDDDYQTPYLQKFNAEINKNYILDFHPECAVNNYDEISVLTQIIRDGANNVIDDLHKTIPFLTKYERTRVIGQRAKQINSGAKAFVKVPENVIDGYLVAELELIQKRIPFIIRRPTPGGGCEYWNLKDLEVVSF
jgi:DNA-directed RNA polymerase I, II, and III subunit RPABC2